MKIKKFVGRNLQDAFVQMKEELGENAIILNTRKIEKTLQSSGEKFALFEVTAALDEGAIKVPKLPSQKAIQQYKNLNATSQREKKGEKDMISELSGVKEPGTQLQVPQASNAISYQQELLQTLQKYAHLESLKKEINEIKSAMSSMAELIEQQRMPALPKLLKDLYKTLLHNEVDEYLARTIVQTILTRLSAEELKDSMKLQVVFQKIVAGLVPIAPSLFTHRKRPYIVVLVGPTGVGKTTTIAKIAANLKIFRDKKVGIITADTFRIAAVEQIQTFANIAGIPMEVVYEPVEMPETISRMKDKDIILIDTVGRSQRKEEQIKQLKKFIDASNAHEVHLVMSLTSSLRNLQDVVNRFSELKPNRYIFTKMDEVAGPGNVLNICHKHKMPVSFITTGQIVPDDIVEPEWPMLTRLLLQGF